MFCQNNLSVWFWSQQRERKNIISLILISDNKRNIYTYIIKGVPKNAV